MSLPPIGSRVDVTIAGQTREVKVTEANQRLLSETDGPNQTVSLDDDLGMIQAGDGDIRTFSAQDFQAVGFTPRDARFLFDAVSTAQTNGTLPTSTYSLPADAGLTGRMAEAFKGTPYLTEGAGIDTRGTVVDGPAAVQTKMQTYLNAQPEIARNGILGEVATSMAMQEIANQRMSIPQYSQVPISFESITPTAAYTNFLNGLPALTGAERQEMIQVAVLHPNMPMHQRNEMLTKLNVTVADLQQVMGSSFDQAAFDAQVSDLVNQSIEKRFTGSARPTANQQRQIETGASSQNVRNQLILLGRESTVAEASAKADQYYQELGGAGSRPAGITLGTGNGSGTNGLYGKVNQGIIFFDYNEILVQSGSLTRSLQDTERSFTVQDASQPVAVHLSGMGANTTGNTLTISRPAEGDRPAVDLTFNVNVQGKQTVFVPQHQDRWPEGLTFDATTQTLTFAAGDARPVTVHQHSNGGDEFSVSATVSNAEATRTVPRLSIPGPQPTEEPDPLPAPPPGTDGVGGFQPNGVVLQPGSVVDKNLDEMAAYLADHPESLATLSVSLESQGAVHNGQRVDERQLYGMTYGTGTLNGETLTRENTAQDRRSEFRLEVSADNRISIVGLGTADPYRATIQGVDRAALGAFMTDHPTLTENDALGALRQLELLNAFQTKLNERLEQNGQPPVDLMGTAEVRLHDGGVMTWQGYQEITGRQ